MNCATFEVRPDFPQSYFWVVGKILNTGTEVEDIGGSLLEFKLGRSLKSNDTLTTPLATQRRVLEIGVLNIATKVIDLSSTEYSSLPTGRIVQVYNRLFFILYAHKGPCLSSMSFYSTEFRLFT